MDPVAQHLLTTLAAAPTLAALQGRVFEGFAVDLPQDVRYPCLTFGRLAMGRLEPYAPTERQPLQIVCYSDIGFNQAWSLLEAVHTLLHWQQATIGAQSLVFRRLSSPWKDVDHTRARIYRVLAMYRTDVFG